jgi:hypothetical protein
MWRENPNLYAWELASINCEMFECLAAAGVALGISLDIQAVKREGFTESETCTIKDSGANLHFKGPSGFEEE